MQVSYRGILGEAPASMEKVEPSAVFRFDKGELHCLNDSKIPHITTNISSSLSHSIAMASASRGRLLELAKVRPRPTTHSERDYLPSIITI